MPFNLELLDETFFSSVFVFAHKCSLCKNWIWNWNWNMEKEKSFLHFYEFIRDERLECMSTKRSRSKVINHSISCSMKFQVNLLPLEKKTTKRCTFCTLNTIIALANCDYILQKICSLLIHFVFFFPFLFKNFNFDLEWRIRVLLVNIFVTL